MVLLLSMVLLVLHLTLTTLQDQEMELLYTKEEQELAGGGGDLETGGITGDHSVREEDLEEVGEDESEDGFFTGGAWSRRRYEIWNLL